MFSMLDITKGSGPDGLSLYLLKQYSFTLARPLYIIFKFSLETGIFLTFWKTCFITINCIPKVFQNLSGDFLSASFKNNFTDQQYDFLAHRSSELNLFYISDFVIESSVGWNHIHALYTDLLKTLFQKSEDMGIQSKLVIWLESYITYRSLIVRVQNFIIGNSNSI